MKVLVLFDYIGEEDDELTIKNGDIIQDVSEFESGWYIGTLNGKVGVFPDNFVKKIENADSGPLPTPTIDSIEVSSQRMVFSQNGSNNDNELKNDKLQKRVVGVGLGNIFNGQQIEMRKTALKNVFKAEASGDKGHALNQIAATAASQSDSVQAVVRFDYVPSEPDELELRVDDIIVILDRNLAEEGWWQGRNLRTNKIGVFPDNFVSLISETTPFTSQPAQLPPQTRLTHPSVKTATSPVFPVAATTTLPTQVGLVSAPLVASSPPNTAHLDGHARTGGGKAEQGQARTEAGGLKVSLSGATAASLSTVATTSTPTTATTTSVASKASLFGGRFLQRNGTDNMKARPTTTAVKDVALGATGHADADVTNSVAGPTNTLTTQFYTANRPRLPGRRLPKAVEDLKIQASTSTGSSQGNPPKADLAPLPCSLTTSPKETPATEVNQSRVGSRQTTKTAAAASKFSESPVESNRAASGDLHKSGGSTETCRQPEVTPPSATRQTGPTDTHRTQVADSQLQHKIEELASLCKSKIDEGRREIQELTRQVDSLKDSNAQLRSDLAQSQRQLTARLQTLMDELDETKKQRASDAIELARLRSLFMHLDAKSLTGQTDEYADHQAEEKSGYWHQDRGPGAETRPDLSRDHCVDTAGKEQPYHHQYQRYLQQTQTQSHRNRYNRQGSQVPNSTLETGISEFFAEDSSQITPTGRQKGAQSVAASLRPKQASAIDQSSG